MAEPRQGTPLARSHSCKSLTAAVRVHGTAKSTGILTELQEYVQELEATAQHQRRQLGLLKEEKRRAEELLWKQQAAAERRSSGPGGLLASFEASEAGELPPRLRALFEDNKVLREEARRYRARCAELERARAAHDSRAAALQGALERARASRPASPEGFSAVKRELDAKAKALEAADNKLRVLGGKVESDARAHRLALAAGARERAALEAKLADAGAALEARDKEARAAALAAKEAKRRMDEARADAARAAAGAEARARAAAAEALAARGRLEAERVHLMLCVVYDEGARAPRRTCAEAAAAAAAADAGSAGRGCWEGGEGARFTRPALGREEAVVRIQAAVRGHQARREARDDAERRRRAAVVIQAGARGMRARLRALEMRGAAAAAAAGGAGTSGGGGGSGGPEAPSVCTGGVVVVGRQGRSRVGSGPGALHLDLPSELPSLPSGDTGGGGSPVSGGSRQRHSCGRGDSRAGPSPGGTHKHGAARGELRGGSKAGAGMAGKAAGALRKQQGLAPPGGRQSSWAAPPTIRSIASGGGALASSSAVARRL